MNFGQGFLVFFFIIFSFKLKTAEEFFIKKNPNDDDDEYEDV